MRLCKERGWQVSGQAFITIRPLPFTYPNKRPTWIFFSSKNAIAPFFAKYEAMPGVKFAALSRATADALRPNVYSVDFEGHGNDTNEIGEQFQRHLLSTDFIWFPGAADGKRSIQGQLQDNSYLDIPLYYTEPKAGMPFEPYDLILFTSPSNVEGYLLNNEILPYQRLLAIGKTTAQKLKSLGYSPETALGFSQIDLFQSITVLIS